MRCGFDCRGKRGKLWAGNRTLGLGWGAGTDADTGADTDADAGADTDADADAGADTDTGTRTDAGTGKCAACAQCRSQPI